jgi:hypothetical protein
VIIVGIDWSEEHHDVEVQDGSGKVLKQLRVNADMAGVSRLQEVILSHAEEAGEVVVGIEAKHGLLVNALIGSGYRVYPINPMTSARVREGESLARAKSDRGDAHLLANLVRTRRGDLRPLAGDSEQAQAVRIRARSHLRAIRLQLRERGQLRAALSQYYPGALALLGEESENLRDALSVLSIAPTPALGRSLSLSQLRAALKQGGRQRNLDTKAAQIQAQLLEPQLQLSSDRLLAAYRDEVASLVRTLRQLRTEISQLEAQMSVDFREHPDAEIILSLPGLGLVLGARVLGESGDDPARFSNAKARKNYAGNSPVTKSSGKWRTVSRRVARNRILADTTFLWANSAISASPGARRYYDQLKGRHKTNNEALRALANRLTGILHGCLRRHCVYDESVAWPTPLEVAA